MMRQLLKWERWRGYHCLRELALWCTVLELDVKESWTAGAAGPILCGMLSVS